MAPGVRLFVIRHSSFVIRHSRMVFSRRCVARWGMGGIGVKITRVTPILVDRCLLVRVQTDEGLVGTGEAGLWSHHRLVYEAINDLAEYFVGRDAGPIEHHFQ